MIEPVLRRARQFSRSNILRESIEYKQTTPNCQNETAVEDSAEKSKITTNSRTISLREPNQGASTQDPPMLYMPSEEDKGFENIFQSRKNVGPSILQIPSRDDLHLAIDSVQSSQVEFNNQTIADSSSSIGSHSVQEGSVTSPTIDSIISDHDLEAEYETTGSTQRSETVEESSRNSNYQRTTPLPEDDKMGKLRRQMRYIQAMDIGSEQKARLMHQLMNRRYLKAQQMSKLKKNRMMIIPSTFINQERSITPVSITSFLWQINGSPVTPIENKQHIFRLSPDDLKQTFVPKENQEIDDSVDSVAKDDTLILGCKHYQRNVKLQCSACEKWYTCRLCHDEVEDHILDRKATKNMLCMLCGCAQKAGEYCVECKERTAWHYCDVCKLWDNDSTKNIYHCNDCGICRRGLGIGKDFFHCKTCGTCMSMSVEHSHKCIERVSDCDCPICGEYMFTSPTPVVFMLCGHGIHKTCYNEHLKSSYKCPICSKSTVNMETHFRNLDRAIVSQPMPPNFRNTKAMVSCNDCCAKSAVKYHWLGLKCAICDSYNTAQLSIMSDSAVIDSPENRDTILPINSDNPGVPSEISRNPVLIQHRRHSTYIYPSGLNDRPIHGSFPIERPRRTARSLSPFSRIRYFDETLAQSSGTDDSSGEEDGELDFWGLNEPRSVCSDDNFEEIEDGDSEEDSGIEDCDDAEDEEDEFALFGHR